jgi:hypothetical protein
MPVTELAGLVVAMDQVLAMEEMVQMAQMVLLQERAVMEDQLQNLGEITTVVVGQVEIQMGVQAMAPFPLEVPTQVQPMMVAVPEAKMPILLVLVQLEPQIPEL